MARFGADVTEAPSVPSASTPRQVQPSEPVAIKGLTNIFRGVREARAAGKQNEGEAFISSFTNKQLGIIQALDQGKIKSSQFARTKMRQELINAINNYPSLRKEILAANASILGTAGMGDIVSEGTREELMQERVTQTLVDEGIVAPDATEQQIDVAAANWRQAQESKRRFEETMDNISLQRAQIGLSQDQQGVLDAKEKAAAEDYLSSTAPVLMQKFQQRSKELLAAIGQEGMDRGRVMAMIEAEFNQFEQELGPALGEVSSHQANALMKGYREFKDLVVKRAKGEFSTEAFQSESKQIIARQEMLATRNSPELARAAALSNLGINDLMLPGQMGIDRAAADFISGNADPNAENPANIFTSTPEGRQGVKTYLDIVSKDYEDNPEAFEEQAQHLERIFGATSTYEGAIQGDPKKAIELTNWMASQKFLNLRSKHPEVFENTDTAMRVLQSNYGDEVWGMVKNEFLDKGVWVKSNPAEGERGNPAAGFEKQVPAGKLVTHKTTSGGMTFVPIDENNQDAKKLSKELNRDLAPIINNTVKAFAHLEGNNNYGQYWDNIASDLMSPFGPDDEEGPREGSLEIEDFETPTSALDRAMTTGGFVGSGDWSQATTPQEVAASFIGFEENEHKQVLSSFIEKTAGTGIDPSKTAWCAAFINAALGAKGVKGTDKLNARSFLDWGTNVRQPEEGDIAVFERGNSSWQGHVGFYVGPGSKPNTIKILGGNQNNRVSIKEMPTSKLLGYRRGNIRG